MTENIKTKRAVEELIRMVQSRWKELTERYKLGPLELAIVDTADELNSDIPELNVTEDDLISNEMITFTKGYTNHYKTLVGIDALVASHVMHFYNVLLGSYGNHEIALWHLTQTMKHEIGHVIFYKSRIGKWAGDEWDTACDECHEPRNFKQPRKNASLRTTFKWYINYFNLRYEKLANEAVGITERDIAIDYVVSNPYCTRKELGVEDYLTNEEFKKIQTEVQKFILDNWHKSSILYIGDEPY